MGNRKVTLADSSITDIEAVRRTITYRAQITFNCSRHLFQKTRRLLRVCFSPSTFGVALGKWEPLISKLLSWYLIAPRKDQMTYTRLHVTFYPYATSAHGAGL